MPRPYHFCVLMVPDLFCFYTERLCISHSLFRPERVHVSCRSTPSPLGFLCLLLLRALLFLCFRPLNWFIRSCCVLHILAILLPVIEKRNDRFLWDTIYNAAQNGVRSHRSFYSALSGAFGMALLAVDKVFY